MESQPGGDLYDFENMTDDEVRDIVREHLQDYPNLDADDIDVVVKNGVVTLSGRVGTDAEVQIAGSVVDDVLGLDDYANDLVVDELRRGHAPVAADAAVEVAEDTVEQLGGTNDQQSDTAEHLVEDLDSETHGTRNVSQAIRDASAYTPPDRPIGDGYGSRENH